MAFTVVAVFPEKDTALKSMKDQQQILLPKKACRQDRLFSIVFAMACF
jgi:hypothetical protein